MAQKCIYPFFAPPSRQASLLAERWLSGVRNGVQSLMKKEADHVQSSGCIVYVHYTFHIAEFVSSRCDKTVGTSA